MKEPSLSSGVDNAIKWYRQSSTEQRRKWLIEWASKVRPELLDAAHAVPDSELTNEVAYLQMMQRGFPITPVYIYNVRYWVDRLPSVAGVRVRAKRTQNSTDPNFDAFDEAVTLLAEGRKIDVHLDPKHSVERVRQYCLEQVETEMGTYTETQLNWFRSVLKQIEELSVRKPRQRKVSAAAQIAKVKWSRKDEKYGLASGSSPLKAMGAKLLYIWDPKQRRLYQLQSKTGIRFESVNLVGLDSVKYVTIRKPEKVMKSGLTLKQLDGIFKSLPAHEFEFKRSQDRFVYLASE